jgi:hypothetical protein
MDVAVNVARPEGRYPVTEAEETTKDWIAYSVDCPECGEPAGFRCFYTTGPETEQSAYGRPRDYLHLAKFHLKGDMTVRPHYQRMNVAQDVIRQRELRELRARRRRAKPAPKPDMTATDKEAYEVKCPLCGREPKRKCVRTSVVKKREMYGIEYTGRWITVHRKGTRIARPHPQRRAAAARLRLERWRRENPGAFRARDVEQARAALAAFDRAEFAQMRDWLKNHGSILWGGERPDGSLRGDSYALG